MINITRCTLADLQALQAISKKTFYETFKNDNLKENMAAYLSTAYTTEKLTSELNNPNTFFYFALINNEVAGYLKLNIADAQSEPLEHALLEVERIYVHSHFQKAGVGKALMQKAIIKAKELQKTAIWLGVWEHNENALAFYENQGFIQFSQHSFFMGDDEQIDLLMKKSLITE